MNAILTIQYRILVPLNGKPNCKWSYVEGLRPNRFHFSLNPSLQRIYHAGIRWKALSSSSMEHVELLVCIEKTYGAWHTISRLWCYWISHLHFWVLLLETDFVRGTHKAYSWVWAGLLNKNLLTVPTRSRYYPGSPSHSKPKRFISVLFYNEPVPFGGPDPYALA